jgi:hypothetical protein
MKYLRTTFFVSIGFFLIPMLVFLLSNAGPEFQPLVSFFDTYDKLNYIITAISGFFGGTSGILLIILQNKERKTSSVIQNAQEMDNFWSEQQIKISSRAIFYSLHDCFLKGNYADVKRFVTPEFYQELVKHNSGDSQIGSELINPVDITETKIIAANDYPSDCNDSVSVLFSGYFIRPEEGVNSEVSSFPVTKKAFKIICNFKRLDQSWKLDSVDDTAALFDIILNYKSHADGRNL